MSTPVAETKPAEEQVPKGEAKEETSTTTSEEVQMKEVEKEATAEPSTAAEPSATAEPSAATEPTATTAETSTAAKTSTAAETSTTAETSATAMEVDSSVTETKPEATTSAEETKPEVKANGATSDSKAKTERALRLNGAARKRFRWLLDQGYSREEAAKLAKEPLKTKELRDRFNADTMPGGNAEADSKVDEELKNLSGAAKKRFKWLLKNGYTEKEALKLAREPMNALGSNKRILSSNDGPPSKVAKPAPDAAGGVVMVVAARDYPTTSLSHAQTNEVKSAILKEVVQQKDSELKPRFESCVHVKGYLRVHCSDQETRQWLQRVVAKLTVPENIKLKVASEKNLLKGDVFTGFFTDSRGDTNEAILEFVESQNDGINTSKWKILTRKEIQNKQTIELMFTVDQVSSKSIHNLGYELNYKFNKIKVRKQLKATDNKAPVVANPNVRMGRSMAPPQQRERRTFNQPRPISSGSFVPIWDSNLPQKRAGNNFNQFDNPRSGNGWSNGVNSFGLGGGGGGSFGMNSGGNNSFGASNSGGGGGGGRSNSFMGSNSRSSSFGGSNSRSNSYGGSNSRSNSNSNSFGMGGGGRGGNQSNSNRPFNLVDSLYDQLKLIGSGATGGNNGNNNSYGSSRRSGGNNSNGGGGSNQWGRNTSSNSSFSGRSNSSLGNRNFFTTTRSGFF